MRKCRGKIRQNNFGMIEVNTKPKAGLNVSKLAISLYSAAEFNMQFNVVGWGKYTNAEGDDVWGNNPIVSTLLLVSGAAWSGWPCRAGTAAPPSQCVYKLGLDQRLVGFNNL